MIKENLSMIEDSFHHEFKEGKKCLAIKIDVSHNSTTQGVSLISNIASSFNDISTSDFIVKSGNEEFFVHQYILKQRSEYFSGLLRNDCQEKRNNKLIIDDFEPKVVEILLRYIYNGALSFNDCQKFGIDLMLIADKYNFMELWDLCDTYFAQHCNRRIDTRDEYLSRVDLVEKTRAPKTAAMLLEMRNSEAFDKTFTDDDWSNLLHKRPNFASVIAHVTGRKDYHDWVEQFLSMFRLYCKKREDNALALIAGPLGKKKGEVQCFSTLI